MQVMKTTVQTTCSFEVAHRLYNVDTYSKECRANVHGHSYRCNIIVSRLAGLNNADMVIDFKLLKKVVKEVIQEPFDHSCILNSEDPLAEPISKNCEKVHIVDDNPTAEWMARIFYTSLNSALQNVDPKLMVESVSVQETENNIATYSRTDISIF